jgi:hypothetical protein
MGILGEHAAQAEPQDDDVEIIAQDIAEDEETSDVTYLIGSRTLILPRAHRASS